MKIKNLFETIALMTGDLEKEFVIVNEEGEALEIDRIYAHPDGNSIRVYVSPAE